MPDDRHSSASSPPRHPLLVRLPHVAGALGILVGCLVLLGWAVDSTALKSLFPGLPVMKANTAVSLALLGVAVWTSAAGGQEPDRPRWRMRLSQLCASVVATMGTLVLAEYVFGWNLGIDQLLFKEPESAVATVAPGRMALPTCIVFMAFGVALLLRDRRPRLAENLLLFSGGAAIFGLAVYAYGEPYQDDGPKSTYMAVHSALTLVVLACGALAARPGRGTVALLASNGVGGVVARRLLPTAIVAPFALSGMLLLSERIGLYKNTTAGTALATANIVVFAGLVLWLATKLNATDTARARAERAVRRGDDRFRALVQHSSDIVSVINAGGIRRYLSPSVERHLGYLPEDLIGTVGIDIVHPDDRPMVRELLAEVADHPGATTNGVYRLLHRDGSERWFDVVFTNLTDDQDVGGIVITARDITERRRAEEALAEREAEARRESEFAQRLIDSSFDAIIVREVDGTIVSWNRGAEETYGWSREEALGRVMYDLLRTESELSREAKQASLLAVGRWDGEVTQYSRDGSRLVIATRQVLLRDDQGKPFRTLTINTDVTAQKEAAEQLVRLNQDLERRVCERTSDLANANKNLEAEIAEREQAQEKLLDSVLRFRFLANAMPQIVWTARPSGQIDYVNQGWIDYTGLSLDSAHGDGWQTIIHPDDSERALTRWESAFRSGDLLEDECRLKRAEDGTYRWHLVRAVPRRDRDGQISQWVGTCTDIEDQKRTVAALRQAHDELERRVQERTAELASTNATLTDEIAERLEVESQLRSAMAAVEEASRLKSEFLSTMSHELRTPMNAIIGYAHLLLDGLSGPLSPEQTADIEQIARSADQLLNLINDVLDLSKIEAGRVDLTPERIDLAELIGQVCDTVRPQAAAKGLELVVEVPPDLPVLEADLTRLRQILLNLVGNAVKFTAEGRVAVHAQAVDAWVEVTVVDTGIGIAQDAMEFIFDEFRQADGSTTRRFGGTGLGLAIARKLARLQGGDITVASHLGEGSIFTLQLPLVSATHGGHLPTSAPALVDPSTSGEPPKPLGASPATVLLIEDDAAFVDLVRRTLEAAETKVIQTARGADGLLLAEALRPSLILLDIGLEDQVNGWQVLHRLRVNPETRDVPVVIVSARDEQGKAATLGATDYLVKPIDHEALLAILKRFGTRPPLDILVVEDEAEMREFLTRLLPPDDYRVRRAADGDGALAQIAATIPDVLILDLLLPRTDGFRVLESVRSNPATADLPVIVVTALDLNAEQFAWLRRQTATVLGKSSLRTESLIKEIHRSLKGGRAEGLLWEDSEDAVIITGGGGEHERENGR